MPSYMSANDPADIESRLSKRIQELFPSGGLSGQSLPIHDRGDISECHLLARFAPGLAKLLEYKLEDAPADIKGPRVTAVAVPVGIAYAGLAGFRPEIGLYSSFIALFGLRDFRLVAPTHCRARCGNVCRDCSRSRSPRCR